MMRLFSWTAKQFKPYAARQSFTKEQILSDIRRPQNVHNLCKIIIDLCRKKPFDSELLNQVFTVTKPMANHEPELYAYVVKAAVACNYAEVVDELEHLFEKHVNAMTPEAIGIVVYEFGKLKKGSAEFWRLAGDSLKRNLRMRESVLSQAVAAMLKYHPENFPIDAETLAVLERGNFTPLGLSVLLDAAVCSNNLELYMAMEAKLVAQWNEVSYIEIHHIASAIVKMGRFDLYSDQIERVIESGDFSPQQIVMLTTTLATANTEKIERKLKSQINEKRSQLSKREICNLLNIATTTNFFTRQDVAFLVKHALARKGLSQVPIDLVTVAHATHKYTLDKDLVYSLVTEEFVNRLSTDEFAVLAFCIRSVLKEPLLSIIRARVERDIGLMQAKHVVNMSVMWTDPYFYSEKTWEYIQPHYDMLPLTFIRTPESEESYTSQIRLVVSRLQALGK